MKSKSELKFSCHHCIREFIYKKAFENHQLTCKTKLVISKVKAKNYHGSNNIILCCPHCSKTMQKPKCFQLHIDKCKPSFILSEVFCFDDSYFCDLDSYTDYDTNDDYLGKLTTYAANSNFNLLHMNINSLFNKVHYFQQILENPIYDLILINETQLDNFVPLTLFQHPKYKLIRRDRNGNGGGVLIPLRKEYNLISYSQDP